MFDSSPWLSYQPKQWQTSCVRCFIPSHCCWIGLTDLSKVCLGRRGFVDGLPSVPSSYSPDMYDRRRESAFLSAYLHSEQCLEKKVYWKFSNEFFLVILEAYLNILCCRFPVFLSHFCIFFESTLCRCWIFLPISLSLSPGIPISRSSSLPIICFFGFLVSLSFSFPFPWSIGLPAFCPGLICFMIECFC